MPLVDVLYGWLAKDRDPQVDRIFSAALEQAEPPFAARMIKLLFERKSESAWTALVSNQDRLDDDARHQLQREEPLLRAGIAAAARSTSAHARKNALLLLAQSPETQLTYLLGDALRDGDAEVRALAAKVLRGKVQCILDESARQVAAGKPITRIWRQNEDLLEVVREGLRTYSLHQRDEVLEVSLWLARELGEALWASLESSSSRTAYAVQEYLEEWNGPRLAAFALLALARKQWRAQGRTMLRSWSGDEYLISLMRNSDLLSDCKIRHGLQAIKQPAWFVVRVARIIDLPPDVRAKLPFWIMHLGYSDSERMNFLRACQASAMPEVHRAAVYTLAELGNIAADHILREASLRPCPMNQFARWYLHGRRLADERGGRSRNRTRDAAQPSALPRFARGAN